MKRRIWIATGVVVVIVAVGIFWLTRPRGADPISEADAVESFRETEGSAAGSDGSDSTTSTTATDGEDGGSATPTPGVYSYATTGREVVKLGPLPAETRDFPETTTAAVTTSASTDDSQLCFDYKLNLIEQHTEDTTWCRSEGGALRFASYAKHQSVAQFNPTVNIACDPSIVWEAGIDSQDLSCDLTLDGGPMEVTTEVTGTSVSSPPESLEVGDGASVEVIPVAMNFDLEGSVSGTWSEKLWLDARSMLPVKIERSFRLEGFATFDEQSTLVLQSTEPNR
ncbi:MAG: hypothetical protein ACK5O2_09305 [Microthrixaceae bacterium]